VKTGSTRPRSDEKAWQFLDIFDAAIDGLIITDLETCLVVEANPAASKMHGYTHEAFIGLPLTAFIHPDSQNGFNQDFGAVQPDGVFDTCTLHMRRDGSTFYAEWRGTPFSYGRRQCLLSIVRDVSKRILAEQLLHQRVEIRSHEQAKILEISHTLASMSEFQPGLILDQLREIIEYTQGEYLH